MVADISLDARVALAISRQGEARFYDVETSATKACLSLANGACAAVLSPTGQLAAVGFADGSVRGYWWERPETVVLFGGLQGGRVCAMAIDPVRELLAVAHLDREVRLWHLFSGEPVHVGLRWAPQDSTSSAFLACRPSGLQFSRDGGHLSMTTQDGWGYLWSLDDGRLLYRETDAFVLAVTHDRDQDRTRWANAHGELWSVEPGGRPRLDFSTGRYWSHAVWSDDARRLLTQEVALDYDMCLAREQRVEVWEGERCRVLRSDHTAPRRLPVLAWHPDGGALYIEGEERVVYHRDDRRVDFDCLGSVLEFRLSADGHYLVARTETALQAFLLETGEPLGCLSAAGAGWTIGKGLLLGFLDGPQGWALGVISLQGEGMVYAQPVHRQPDDALLLAPEGDWLFGVSQDAGRLTGWEMERGRYPRISWSLDFEGLTEAVLLPGRRLLLRRHRGLSEIVDYRGEMLRRLPFPGLGLGGGWLTGQTLIEPAAGNGVVRTSLGNGESVLYRSVQRHAWWPDWSLDPLAYFRDGPGGPYREDSALCEVGCLDHGAGLLLLLCAGEGEELELLLAEEAAPWKVLRRHSLIDSEQPLAGRIRENGFVIFTARGTLVRVHD